MNRIQRCVVCAWRGNCAKRFSVSDSGARCPDFSRDVTIKDLPEDSEEQNGNKEPEK